MRRKRKQPSAPQIAGSADLLRRVQAGEERAASEVFARYVERLTRLARSRLAARLAARVDPEDIVQSAYRSFFVAAQDGRFTVHASGDLWRLLVEITLHKLYRQAARHTARRRGASREAAVDAQSVWQRVAGKEPTPEQAAIASEELERLLAQLPPRGRDVVELVLQGHEQREVAARLGCTDRTVRRWIEQAREILRKRVPLPPQPNSRGAVRGRVEPRPPEAATTASWSDYLLKQQIGAGATGKVYRAVERRTGRLVAVKFLRKALVREPAVVERFLREAQIVAVLEHPSIVPIEGIGRTPGGGWFLVMQLIKGRDLAQAASERSITPRQAAAWIAAAANVVQFAHDRGIIHCDLKPGNLILDAENRIWITDFGLAIRRAEEAFRAILAGTPAFMAPEQVDPCWGEISPRTDVWGLGAVLYFLLYGRPPHQGRDVADTLARVVAGTPVSFPPRKGLSRQSINACRWALAKRPADRFASAEELATALGAM